MPDQLTDSARRAAEEILNHIKKGAPNLDLCLVSQSGDCRDFKGCVDHAGNVLAAIIERYWREHIESEKKMICFGEIPDGCSATGDCECRGKCYECDWFDDQHFVVRRGPRREMEIVPHVRDDGIVLEMKALQVLSSWVASL